MKVKILLNLVWKREGTRIKQLWEWETQIEDTWVETLEGHPMLRATQCCSKMAARGRKNELLPKSHTLTNFLKVQKSSVWSFLTKLKIALPYGMTWKTPSQHTPETPAHQCSLKHCSQKVNKGPNSVPINRGMDKGNVVCMHNGIKPNGDRQLLCSFICGALIF